MTQKRLDLLCPLLFRRLAGSSANFCGQLFSAKISLFLMLQYRRNICKHSLSTSVKGVTCCRLESSVLYCATMEMFVSIYHMHHSVHSQKPTLQRLRYRSTLGPKQNLSFRCWCHLQAKLGQIVTCKLPSVVDRFNFNIEPHEYICSLNNPSLISKSLRLFYWNNVSGITNENHTGSFLFSRQFKFQTLLL